MVVQYLVSYRLIDEPSYSAEIKERLQREKDKASIKNDTDRIGQDKIMTRNVTRQDKDIKNND